MRYFICPCWSRVVARHASKDISSHMKKKLRAVGAAGLAAATIVTGLSFGPAATAAQFEQAPEGATQVGPLVTASTTSDYSAPYSTGAAGQIPMRGFSTAAAAKAAAEQWSIPTAGSISAVHPMSHPDLCLAAKSTTPTLEPCVPGDSTQKWKLSATVSSFDVGGTGLESVERPGNYFGFSYRTDKYMILQPGGSADRIETIADFESFSAEVTQADLNAGTATIRGLAPAEATNVRIDWTDEAERPKSKTVSVSDGKYSAYLDGLKIGTTTVELTAREGTEPIATTTVDVKLEVAPVTATATFADDVHTVVQLSGTAQPNAKVTVRHGEDDLVTVKANAEGKWSTPINAPNMPGNYELTVGQEIRGQDNGRVSVDIDYGAGVVVTSPDDDFVLEPNQPLEIEGTAPAGTEVNVYDKTTNDVLASTTAAKNNTWFASVDGLEDREYTLVAAGITKGNNRTHSDLKINPGKTTVEPPEGEAVFDADVTKKATVKGTGAAGATITVKNGSETLGTTTVNDNGTWSLAIHPIGPGKHTLTLEQTSAEGTQTGQTEIDYGAGVGITAPAAGTVSPGKVHVTGTGAHGAAVRVEAGAETATATVVDGTWSTDIEIPASKETTEIKVAQQSKGALTTHATVSVTPNGSQQLRTVAITDPESGTYSNDGKAVEVKGTATPYATVAVKSQWSTLKTVTADRDGNWSFWRGFGPNVTYQLTATQTTISGQTSDSAVFTLAPEGGDLNAPVVITDPADGHYASSGATQIKGTAAANATVEVRADWGVLATVKADGMGNWSFWRGFGPNVTYHLVAKQTKADGNTSESAVFTLSPEGADPNAPVTITGPADGHYLSGAATQVKGTAGANATVEIRDQWKVLTTVKADGKGNWSFWRHFGPDVTYNLIAKQTKTDGNTSESAVFKLAPKASQTSPVVITGPTDGYDPSGAGTLVSGTASPGASVEVRSQWGVLKTVTADEDGNWSFWRGFGPTVTYDLIAKQTRTNETTSESVVFHLAPKTAAVS
jgi:hypothetical protein